MRDRPSSANQAGTHAAPRCLRRKFASVLLVAGVAVYGCTLPPESRLPAAPLPVAAARSSGELRVATYNLYVGNRDLTQSIATLRRMDADVVALQEVTPANAAALDRELAADYPHRTFGPGLGMLSRFPLRHPHYERSCRGINGFLIAEIDHPRGPVQIANLHLDPLHLWSARDLFRLPFQFAAQREIQHQEVLQALAHLRPGQPTLLIGDFNRVSDDVIQQLQSLGFTDSFAAFQPDPDRFCTLHFSLLGIPCGRRIDFIFHDRHFRTRSSHILPGRPSDHDALLSRLDWGPVADGDEFGT